MDSLQLFDTSAHRKARGAFFTPAPLAQYLTDWAIRSGDDAVLEPSCGEAVFLMSAWERLRTLSNGRIPTRPRLDGIELHEESAETARHALREAGAEPNVKVGDFFTFPPSRIYDVVIGNPPYIRYQDFSGESRTRSRAAALAAGVRLTNLASSWAAFTVHAALFLKDGGRLALVLPAELLSVNYAGPVRRFLMDHFATVNLVLFEERVFPGVLEEVVLLLAEGYGRGPTNHCRILQARNAEDLPRGAAPRLWSPAAPGDKWTPSLLSNDALDVYESLCASKHFTTLQSWGATTLGIVTGNNRYFAINQERVDELGLAETELLALSPPGSRHLRGLSFTRTGLDELRRTGARVWLFRPSDAPSPAAERYIKAGERLGVHRAYKCRIRQPWWRVPLVDPADLLLTYMNADTPRLCTNRVGVRHLNSVHGIYLRPSLRRLGKDLLSLATLNSMTLLGAETVGRAYGGGMLKIEPREADSLPVPSPQLIEASRKRLSDLRSRVAGHLSAGRLADAVRLVDDALLVAEMGMSRDEVETLREGHRALSARRAARGVGSRGTR